MTPEEFIPYLRGLLDAQTEETPLVSLLRKKLNEVQFAPKVKFPIYRNTPDMSFEIPRKDAKLPPAPSSSERVYC